MPDPGSRLFAVLLGLALFTSLARAQITFTNTGYGTGEAATSVVTGDFNRDGLPDFAVTTAVGGAPQFGHTLIFANNGNGTFSQTASYATPDASLVRTADVNRDGKLDLVVASGALQVLLGNGDGTFRPGQRLTVPNFSRNFELGDFNHDGYPDLVVGRCAQSQCGMDFYKNAAGTFAFSQVLVPPSSSVTGIFKITDLNADNNLDVMYTTAAGLVTRFSNGTGAFTATYTVPLAGAFRFIVSKFNHAANAPDVVVDSPGPGPCPGPPAPLCPGFINVFSNNGKGVLTRTQRFLTRLGLYAAGDIDGDGLLDLVSLLGTTSTGFIDYFPGKGNGSFRSGISLNFQPFTAGQPEIRDLRLNGRHDILYPEFVSAGVTVLLNNNAPVICTPPSASAVHAKICAPAPNSNLPSAFTVTGSGNAPAGLLRLELWMDGKKLFETRNDQLRYSAHASPGRHQLTVVAVDPSNAIAKQTISLVVR
jgi:FG-GAP-like repeat